jgi:hypothetical protein
LTSKEICALAFECEPQRDFPVFSWNVTLPNTPKPTPQPPKPPSVSQMNKLNFSFLFKKNN